MLARYANDSAKQTIVSSKLAMMNLTISARATNKDQDILLNIHLALDILHYM